MTVWLLVGLLVGQAVQLWLVWALWLRVHRTERELARRARARADARR